MRNLILLLVAFIITGPGIAYSKLYAFHVVLFALIIVHLIDVFKDKTINIKNVDRNSVYFLTFFLIWYILSLLWSLEKSYTLQYIFYLLNGFLIIYFITTYSRTTKKLITLLNVALLTLGIQMIIAFLESYTPFRYPLSNYSINAGIFGRQEFEPTKHTDNILEKIEAIPTGFMGNPNNLATVLILFLPYFLFMKNRKVGIPLSTLLMLIVINTGSRANIIASIFVIFLYIVVFNYKKIKKVLYVIPIALLILVIPLYFMGNIEQTGFNKITNTFKSATSYIKFQSVGEENSIGIRQTLITNGLKGLSESKFIGVGGGASRTLHKDTIGTDASMHNFWIEILVEGGALFFIAFIIWYAYLMIKLYLISLNPVFDQNIKYLSSSTLLSLVGFIPAAISPSSVIYLLPMWFIFALSISIISIVKKTRYIYMQKTY